MLPPLAANARIHAPATYPQEAVFQAAALEKVGDLLPLYVIGQGPASPVFRTVPLES